MTSNTRRRRAIAAAVLIPLLAVVAIPESREAAWRLMVPRADAEAATVELQAVLADRKLHVAMPDGSEKTYDVAIGTRAYPTPTGSFSIRKIIWNPGWVPPDSPWARGKRARGPGDPGNPMKVAKIFFKQPDYYIHGTGHVASLGTAASHGCLRMHPDEVAELGALVMQAGGVAHDWEWVKRTLRFGSTRTVNLKRPVRITIVSDRPEPAAPVPAPADTAAPADSIPTGGTGPSDSSSAPTPTPDAAG